MSLVVWLPLNGNLNNQGLSDISITNNGVTVENNGKIGKCYYFDGSKYLSTDYEWNPSTTFSACVWVCKDNKTDGGTIFRNTSGCSPIIDFNHTSGALRIFFWYSDSSYKMFTYPSIESNTWYHLAITYDGVSFKLYVNGNLEEQIATNSVPYSSGTLNVGKANGANYFKGKMNDFRIYDHCLSAKEIKEIAKGLLLHYKLSSGIGNKNLLKNSAFNGATNWGGVNGGSVSIETIDNRTTLTATKGTSNYLYCSTLDFTHTAGSTDTLTFSAMVYAEVTGTVGGGVWINSGGWQGAGSFSISPNTLNVGWNSITGTISVTHKTLTGNPIIAINYNQPKLYLYHPKIEEGSIVTTWIPHTSDTLYDKMGLNDNIEYDCSGFNNNGVKDGNLSYDASTIRNKSAIKFNDLTSTITPPSIFTNGQTLTQFSTCIWAKTTTLNSTAPNLISLGENSFWRFRIASATAIWYYIRVGSTQVSSTFSVPNTVTSSLIDGKWHHYAFTFKDGITYFYVDGTQIGTTNHTSTATYLTCASVNWHIGGYTASSEKFVGSLSDARIYATALSDGDIKELYNVSASVDKNGNTYAYEFEEV